MKKFFGDFLSILLGSATGTLLGHLIFEGGFFS